MGGGWMRGLTMAPQESVDSRAIMNTHMVFCVVFRRCEFYFSPPKLNSTSTVPPPLPDGKFFGLETCNFGTSRWWRWLPAPVGYLNSGFHFTLMRFDWLSVWWIWLRDLVTSFCQKMTSPFFIFSFNSKPVWTLRVAGYVAAVGRVWLTT